MLARFVLLTCALICFDISRYVIAIMGVVIDGDPVVA
jgi:hypothetical protein